MCELFEILSVAGVAPNAKLSFFDIGVVKDGEEVLFTPGDCLDDNCDSSAKGSVPSIFALHHAEVGFRIKGLVREDPTKRAELKFGLCC